MAQWVKELAIKPVVLNFILRTLWRRKLSPESVPPYYSVACMLSHTQFLFKKYEQWLHFSVDQYFYLYFSNYALRTWVLNLLARCNTFSGKASYFAVLRQSFPHTRWPIYHQAAPLPTVPSLTTLNTSNQLRLAARRAGSLLFGPRLSVSLTCSSG